MMASHALLHLHGRPPGGAKPPGETNDRNINLALKYEDAAIAVPNIQNACFESLSTGCASSKYLSVRDVDTHKTTDVVRLARWSGYAAAHRGVRLLL